MKSPAWILLISQYLKCPSCAHLERQNSNVYQRSEILRRLARRHRHSPPQIVRNRKGCTHLRTGTAQLKPKTQGERNIAQILLAFVGERKPGNTNGHNIRAAQIIIAAAGSLQPSELHAAHAYDIDAAICGQGYSHSTRVNTAAATIRLLKRLERYHGAPALAQMITRHPGLRPRNITATEEECERILTTAPPHLRLFTLICSDLAIRSGTAVRIGPSNYDAQRKMLRFTTKLGEKLTLPVTQEIAEIFASCDLTTPTPFIRQLHNSQPNANLLAATMARYNHTIGGAFRAHLRKLGITRKLTPHDFRRTTAVKLYEATGDARDVQALLGHRSLASTIWYLDHDLRPVNRATLELIKLPRNERRTA